MSIHKLRLDKASTRFVDEVLRNADLAKSTIDSKSRTLRFLCEVAGNINTRDLTAELFANTITCLRLGAGPRENAQRAKDGKRPRIGRGYNALKEDHYTLRTFAAWLKDNNLLARRVVVLPVYTKPTAPRGTAIQGIRKVLPVDQWNDFLDLCGQHHPRTRMTAVLGLLWGRRVGELVVMRWSDFDVEALQGVATNVKSRKLMLLPIDQRIAAELTTWRERVEGLVGSEPEPHWYLLPAKLRPQEMWRAGTRARVVENGHLHPIEPLRPALSDSLSNDIKLVLKRMGWTDVKGEGVHTLRRSVATAYDEMGEIQLAQALLGHTRLTITEGYTQNRAGTRRLAKFMHGGDPFGLRPTPPAAPKSTQSGDNVVEMATWRRKLA